MTLKKRISKIEQVTPSEKTDRPIFQNLAELYEWENSPEGQAERNYLLYNPESLPCSLREATELYRKGGKDAVERLRNLP